jgi:hypothetical protein
MQLVPVRLTLEDIFLQLTGEDVALAAEDSAPEDEAPPASPSESESEGEE